MAEVCRRAPAGNGDSPRSGPANACGFVMCLSGAVGFPSTITELLPKVEQARQRMYDMSKLLCMGPILNQDLAFPEIVQP